MMHAITVQNWRKKLLRMPMEDAVGLDKSKGIMVVADGVTRDCLNGRVADSSLRGAWDIFWSYPRPSPAQDASVTFVQRFLYSMEGRPISCESISESFMEVNNIIDRDNRHDFPTSNYLDEDLAGCVSAVVACTNFDVYWGYIADSGVALLNRNGDLRAKTCDEGPHSKKNLDALDYVVTINGGWKNPTARKVIRSKHRNNPEEAFSYGVLNGQEMAIDYVKTGRWSKRPGDFVLVYTDGCAEHIFNGDGDVSGAFADILVRGNFKELERFFKRRVSSEGTLVYSKD